MRHIWFRFLFLHLLHINDLRQLIILLFALVFYLHKMGILISLFKSCDWMLNLEYSFYCGVWAQHTLAPSFSSSQWNLF